MKNFRFLTAVATLILVLSACGNSASNSNPNVINIGATLIPHSEILAYASELLEEQGFEMNITIFDDFIQPNLALAAGDIDINFFQHVPFLNNFNDNHGTNLVPVFGVHFEPLRLYAGRLDNIYTDITNASIGIPDDPTNEARALQLLEYLELISLPVGIGLTATANDIVNNPHNLNIIPMSAELLPRALEDLEFAVINGNFALLGGVIDLAIDGAGEIPGSEAAVNFTNYIVVRVGDENDDRVQALINVLNTEAMRQFIYSEYDGRVVPSF